MGFTGGPVLAKAWRIIYTPEGWCRRFGYRVDGPRGFEFMRAGRDHVVNLSPNFGWPEYLEDVLAGDAAFRDERDHDVSLEDMVFIVEGHRV